MAFALNKVPILIFICCPLSLLGDVIYEWSFNKNGKKLVYKFTHHVSYSFVLLHLFVIVNKKV